MHILGLLKYLDKVIGILLTVLLWYLQEYQKDPNCQYKEQLKEVKFDIAMYALLFAVIVSIFISVIEKNKKKKTIDQWLHDFLEHIMELHLEGGNAHTRITIFKCKKGYQLILHYLVWYPLKAMCLTQHKVLNRKFLKNIPYKLFSSYLTICSRYGHSSDVVSYTHFLLTNRNDVPNGLADYCWREQIVLGVSTNHITHSDLTEEYKDTDKIVKEYMKETKMDEHYYSTLVSLNTIANNLLAIPLFEQNQKIWGVMMVDNDSEQKISYQDKLQEYLPDLQNIFSFTIKRLK